MTTFRALTAAAALSVAAHAQCGAALLDAGAPPPEAQWCHAVALQGDEAFGGMPWDFSLTGEVRMFRRVAGAWQPAGTLFPEDDGIEGWFGWSLAVHGDVLVVGGPATFEGDVLTGAAFVFERAGGTWVQAARLVPSDGANIDNFGQSVAVHDDVIVVGAPDDDGPGASSFSTGAAYVFRRGPGGWTEEAKLKPDGLTNYDQCGKAVAVSADSLAVGIPAISGSQPGRVELYAATPPYAHLQTLVGQGTDFGDRFGFSLDFDGPRLAVAASGDEPLQPFGTYGSLHLFEEAGGAWTQTAKLALDDAADHGALGISLDLDGGRLAAGSGLAQSSFAPDVRSVVLFQEADGGWLPVLRLQAPAGATKKDWSAALALDGDQLLVASSPPETSGESGSLVAFTLGEPLRPYGAGLPGKFLFTPWLQGVRCRGASGDEVRLEVVLGLGGAVGLLLAGGLPAQAPFKGGVLLVAPPWREYAHGLGGMPGAPAAGVAMTSGLVPPALAGSGLQVFLQALYADPAAAQDVALTRGVLLELD